MKTTYFLLIIAIVALGVTGCTAYQSSFQASAQEVTPRKLIIISDYQFQPGRVTVRQGDTITWRNLDSSEHSLYYNNAESDLLEKNEEFSIIASVPGVFEYRSGNHPFMTGTIIVTNDTLA